MEALKNWWNGFADKHPKLAEWVRKGGLFLLFSYFVTFLKAILLMFLPDLFRGMEGIGNAEWLWPNIPVTLFGVNFNLAISARYACFPTQMTVADILRLVKEKDYDQAIRYITITADSAVTVAFR